MKEDDLIKKDLNDLYFSYDFKEKLEKINNSNESFNLSTKKIKDKYNAKENRHLKINESEMRIGNYLIKKTLGKGTFGKVKLGIYLPKNKKVAIKILEKRKIIEEDDLIRLKREFEMLTQFNHPNVITVSEIFESPKAYFTVMEFCEGGELFSYIVKNKYLSEEKSAFFYYQLISGLEYIHSLGIVHRDLKPENLLLTHDHILKIIDFGLSNYFNNGQLQLLETPCGSPCYASPEMLSGSSYDGFKIDIWATGIILFAMLCGYLPFDDKNNNILFQKILECNINFPKGLSYESKDLLKKILVKNPLNRITIKEIKKHPFYLKGKYIFEKNFTIYQINTDDMSNSEDSEFFYDFKNMNENYLVNNLLYYDIARQSQIFLNKLLEKELFICPKLKKRSSTYKFFDIKNKNEIGYEDTKTKKIFKKIINLEKKLKKMKNKPIKKRQKINDINNILIDKNKFLIEKEEYRFKNKFLNNNHSISFHIKDINVFVENLIIQYKIEEELKNLKKQNKNYKCEILKNGQNNLDKKHKKSNKSEDTNILRNKLKKKIIINNKIKKSKEKSQEKDKYNKSSLGLPYIKKDDNTQKNIESKNYLKTQPNNNVINNKKAINQNKKNILKNKTNKVKLNNKQITRINKLFINKNKILKINKLTESIKFKKERRRIRSTSNNSKKKNFKNILKKIKEQSLKASINLINKKNIIHHHITNITNMTQKNYFSNVIINNYKGREDNKNNSTSKNNSKILFDMPKFKIGKILNLKTNINQVKKNQSNNSNLKNNLQKLIFKDDNILKNSITLNSKTIINIEEEGKRKPKSKNQKFFKKSKEKELENKTIPAVNNPKRKQYKIKVSFINNNKENNNIYLNTENIIRNSSINKDKKDNQSYINGTKKFKILITDSNFDEETTNGSKINFITAENSYTNRNNKKTIINSFDINKVNNYISNRPWNHHREKKTEIIKKNNFNFKKINFPKLNIKEIIRDNVHLKTEPNSLKFPNKINTQRNKSKASTNKKVSTYHYLNSARNNDKKIINNSYNIGNKHFMGNLKENNLFLNNKIFKLCKFNTSQNNIRNKNIINNNNNNKKIYNANITSENSRINSSKNKSLINSNNEVNSLIINKNNKNIYLDKFLISKKLLASLRKRTNIKSMLISNIFDKKLNTKTQKNSIKISRGFEKNKINNSVILNFPNNVKQIKFNNIVDNAKISKKSNCFKNKKIKTDLCNSLLDEKIKHQKQKSMKGYIKKNSKN